MKKEYYVQCELVKGTLKTVAWIEEKYAVLNKTVGMKTKDGLDEGWKVTYIGQKMDYDYVRNASHNSSDIWIATSGPCPRGNK